MQKCGNLYLNQCSREVAWALVILSGVSALRKRRTYAAEGPAHERSRGDPYPNTDASVEVPEQRSILKTSP
jgi:hypothetical protein